MAKNVGQYYLAFLLFGVAFCIELPIGLRPAKALGEPERAIIPGPETEVNFK